MCGRGRLCLSLQQIKEAGNVKNNALCPNEYKSTANFSPGNASPVVISRLSDETREVHMMLFGLIPNFTSKNEKPNHYIMFNASKFTFSRRPILCVECNSPILNNSSFFKEPISISHHFPILQG